MTKLSILAVLTFSASASGQSWDSCGKKTFLFSREIFLESLTITRSIALAEEAEKCQQENSMISAKPVETTGIERDRYLYWKEFHSRQTPDGLDKLYIPTELLVDRVASRKP